MSRGQNELEYGTGSSASGESYKRPILHFLAGARITDLARILWSHGGVDARSTLQLLVMIASALARAPGCAVESYRVAESVKGFSFDPPPVFIVGHWRSGTTYLHNLMSQDPALCFPAMTEVARPFDFYPGYGEFISRWVIVKLLPKRRPMDELPLEPHLPQEEEIALATMGAPSFFNCFYFPRRLSEVFAREVLFDGASPDMVRDWGESLRYFLAKVGALHPGRRLLLKNPAHSARIDHLRALFPNAKFIHIHRHPVDVFRSTRKLYGSLLPLLALQPYDGSAVDEHILWSYQELMSRLLDSLEKLPASDMVTVSYDQLVADPVGTVGRIYNDLSIGGFAGARPLIQEGVRQRFSQPNRVDHLDEASRSRIAFRWSSALSRLGYSMSSP